MNETEQNIFADIYSIIERHDSTREDLFSLVDSILVNHDNKDLIIPLLNLVTLYSSLYKTTEKHLMMAEKELFKLTIKD